MAGCPLRFLYLAVAASFLIVAAAPPAQADTDYYYFSSTPHHFTRSVFHAAVATPDLDSRTRLEKLVTGTFGADARFITVAYKHLTIVSVQDRSYTASLASVLEGSGLTTLVAFGGHEPDGMESLPSVALPEMRVRFASPDQTHRWLPLFAKMGITILKDLGTGVDFLVLTKSSTAALELAARLVEDGSARFAYPDLLYRHMTRMTPNDTFYDQQWHLPLIGAEAAWDINTGSSSVIIAIIDSGVDTAHADLSAHLVSGYDTLDDDADPRPSGSSQDEAHGTCCAGLAAAITNNNRGVAGVCQQCKIMPLRMLSASGAYGNAYADENAFSWARQHGATIMSNSWGPPQPAQDNYLSPGLADEIHTAVQNGIPVVFAAGNANVAMSCPGGEPWEPAAHPEVIAVGASDPYDERESYSSFSGSSCPLVLVAPAASVSTDITGTAGYNSYDLGSNDYVDQFGGTSAATPVTSGSIGLMLSLASSMSETLTVGQIVDILKRSADKIGGVSYTGTQYGGFNTYYGYGRLNIYRALGYIQNGTMCTPDAGGENYDAACTTSSCACHDGRDNDCDGLVDDADPSCQPSTVSVGSPCTGSSCPGGKTCMATQFPGGYCTAYCQNGTTCEAGAACWTCYCDTGAGHQANCDCDPDGCACNTTAGVCDPESSGSQYACACDPDCNVCMDTCINDVDCRDGYVCMYAFSTTVKVCIPGCQNSGWECQNAAETCNTTSGWCEHNGPNAVGATCTNDDDCSSNGLCIPSDTWPDGYCAPECGTASSCPAQSACVPFTDISLCLAKCSALSDCRTGYGCWAGYNSSYRVCAPLCTASDCGNGEVCCAETGGCEPTSSCQGTACDCDTGAGCQSGCACDPDCCDCNTGAGCQSNCACDPDCSSTCACNTGAGCQSGCACDPDCSTTCACNTGAGCQSGCACDPDCGSTSCSCDKDYFCTPNCTCDTECPCKCDTTYGCDQDCPCDYDCKDAKQGCGCASTEAAPFNVAALLAGLVAWAIARRRVKTPR